MADETKLEHTLVDRLRVIAKEWRSKAAEYDAQSEAPTKNDDGRRTALAKFIVSIALRDCAATLLAALPTETP